jgi:hypothetical protein
MHIAMKVEMGSGEKLTKFSADLRRCLRKLNFASDDGHPYYRATGVPPRTLSLRAAIEGMSERVAKTREDRISRECYMSTAYTSINEFVKDVAALANRHPDLLTRRVDGGTTVLASLVAATTPKALGYVMNIGRFVARHPHVGIMQGTTSNEAYHMELKSYFRNVMVQTKRHARMISQVATLTKLIALSLKRRSVSRCTGRRTC